MENDEMSVFFNLPITQNFHTTLFVRSKQEKVSGNDIARGLFFSLFVKALQHSLGSLPKPCVRLISLMVGTAAQPNTLTLNYPSPDKEEKNNFLFSHFFAVPQKVL